MSKRLTKNEMPRTMLGVLGPKQILVSDMVGAAGRSVMREVVTPDPHTGGRRLLPGTGGRAWVDAAPKAGPDRGQSRGRRCGQAGRSGRRQHSETSSYKANATMSEVLTLKSEGRFREKAYSATVLVDKLAMNMSATLQQAEGNVGKGPTEPWCV